MFNFRPCHPLFPFPDVQDESLAFGGFRVAVFALRRLGGSSWLFHLPQRGALIGATCIEYPFAAIGARSDTKVLTKRSTINRGSS